MVFVTDMSTVMTCFVEIVVEVNISLTCCVEEWKNCKKIL